MRDNLQATRVHSEPPQKLEIFSQPDCGHPDCTTCIPGRPWYVVDKPAGVIVGKCDTWAHALDFAAYYLRAALTPEVCS